MITPEKNNQTCLPEQVKMFSCDKCEYKSDRKANLIRHKNIHDSNTKQFSCDKCEYKSNRKDHLTKHKNKMHPQPKDPEVNSHCCSVCDYKTNVVSELTNHEKTHHWCSVCDYKTDDVSKLTDHEKTHRRTGEKSEEKIVPYNPPNAEFTDPSVKFQSLWYTHRQNPNVGSRRFGVLNGGCENNFYVPDSEYPIFIAELAERQSQRAKSSPAAFLTFVNELGNAAGEKMAPLFLDFSWEVPYKTLGNANNTFQHPALKKEIFDDIIWVVVSVLDRYVDGTTAHKKEYWKFSVTCPNRLRFYEHGIKFGGHLRAEQRKTETGESIGGPLLSKENLKNVATLIAHALTKDTTLGPLLDWFEVVDPAPLSAQGMRLPREFKGKETKKEKYCMNCYPREGDAVMCSGPCGEKCEKVCHVPVACYRFDERDDESLQELTGTTKEHMHRTLTRLSIYTQYSTQAEADEHHNGGHFKTNTSRLLQNWQEIAAPENVENRICGADVNGDGISRLLEIQGSTEKPFTPRTEYITKRIAGVSTKEEVLWTKKNLNIQQIQDLHNLVRSVFPHYGDDVEARELHFTPQLDPFRAPDQFRLRLRGSNITKCLQNDNDGTVVSHVEETYILFTKDGIFQKCCKSGCQKETTKKEVSKKEGKTQSWDRPVDPDTNDGDHSGGVETKKEVSKKEGNTQSWDRPVDPDTNDGDHSGGVERDSAFRVALMMQYIESDKEPYLEYLDMRKNAAYYSTRRERTHEKDCEENLPITRRESLAKRKAYLEDVQYELSKNNLTTKIAENRQKQAAALKNDKSENPELTDEYIAAKKAVRDAQNERKTIRACVTKRTGIPSPFVARSWWGKAYTDDLNARHLKEKEEEQETARKELVHLSTLSKNERKQYKTEKDNKTYLAFLVKPQLARKEKAAARVRNPSTFSLVVKKRLQNKLSR